MYPVQYALADDLKALIEQIFENDEEQTQAIVERPRRSSRRVGQEETPSPTAAEPDGGGISSVQIGQIISDVRTNTLIIRANERSYDRVYDMLQQLDVPIPNEGQIHVLFLENADATELASTLQSLTQSVQDQREESGPRRGDDEPPVQEGSVSASFSGDISITSDEATNSLVVVASLRDFLALRNVIDQLDRRRQQVYVEAVIMEVTLNRSNQFGIAVNGGAPLSFGGEDGGLYGATSLGGLQSTFPDPTSVTGLGLGLLGPSLEVGGLSISSVGALLQASQTDSDVNILSTPHILTMDNEEAEIVVGENIPFISGISSGLGALGGLASSLGDGALGDIGGALGGLGGLGGGFPSVSVQRQDVALTLRITPQINESNFVRLEIEEEVEDVQSIDPVLGPRTTTRQVRTTVVVADQETIVIGGLMRDAQIEDVNKVPILGDIPIIGRLFRQTSTRDTKTNLLLMLTPYIIRDSADFQEIFRRKMEEREEFIRLFGRRDIEYVQSVDYGRKDGPMQLMFERISEAVEREEQRRTAFADPTEEIAVPGPEMAPLRIEVEDNTPQGGLLEP
jgi:general secretion pathway protein D